MAGHIAKRPFFQDKHDNKISKSLKTLRNENSLILFLGCILHIYVLVSKYYFSLLKHLLIYIFVLLIFQRHIFCLFVRIILLEL